MCLASGQKAARWRWWLNHKAADDVGLNQQGRTEKLEKALSEEYARFSAMSCWVVDTCVPMH